MRNKPYTFYETEIINNLKELVNYTAKKYGDRPAFTFEHKKEIINVSYCEFKSDTQALSTALFDMGIQNEKVAIIGENSYEWILTYFAVVNSGNVIVPLDRELSETDVGKLLDNADVKTFVYSDGFIDIVEYLQTNGANIRNYINIKELPKLIKKGKMLISQGEKAMIDYQVNHCALTALLYTSGTTGIPKGVMLSHYSLARDAVASCQSVKIRGSNLLVLPLHHSFGFTGGVLYMMLSGSEIIINKSLKRVSEDFIKFKPHNIFLVPLFVETFYKKIWDSAKKQGKDNLLKKLIGISNVMLKINIDLRRVFFKSVLQAFGGNLELIVTGGAPIDSKFIQGFRNFGITTLNGYGITECSPVVSVNRNNYYRDGSVGQICPWCEVKILEPDEDGFGEICVRGDIVMLGYYKNEQATNEVFDDNWFKTGDIGYLDNDKFLYITGRKKNLIILSNGKNINPEDLECELMNLPLVKEVVVREGKAEKGEVSVLIAEIFPDYDEVNNRRIDNLQAHFDDLVTDFNRTLPSYKRIQRVILRETEFVKTTTKKIKRNMEA